MKAIFRTLLLAAALLVPCASAGAANVTVGPSLTGAWESAECAKAWCTFVNTEVEGAGRIVASPVDGAVVGFSVAGGSTTGSYRLRSGNQLKGLGFDFDRLGDPVAAVPNPGIQSYDTVLPVKKGQSIGLAVSEGASMAFQGGGQYTEWVRELPASGEALGQAGWPENVGYDVEIQPEPTITNLSETSGPTAGGTSVTITGADLEGASAVTFGGVPASSFEARSTSRIVAVAPPSKTSTAVPVAVTTLAGTGTGPRFSYGDGASAGSGSGGSGTGPGSGQGSATSRCVVPNLKGKRLAAAKKALAKARCGLGKVTKLAGATAKSGEVTKQAPKAGTRLIAGGKVAVTLKPPKVRTARHMPTRVLSIDTSYPFWQVGRPPGTATQEDK